MKEVKKGTRTQYIVQVKYRGTPNEWDRIAVTLNSRTNKLMYSLEEAMYEIERLKREDARDRGRGSSVTMCGNIGVRTTHYSEYDIIAYRVLKREVSPYETEYEETVG